MDDNVGSIERLDDLPPGDQKQIRAAIRLIRAAIVECLDEPVGPGLIANVLLSEAAKLLAVLGPENRQFVGAAIMRNFPLMLEDYAEQTKRKRLRRMDG